MITKPTWHVVYTYPNAEKKLHQRLLERGLESFLPTRKEISLRRDRRRTIDVPLFTSYVFVKVNNQTIDQVRYSKGFASFIQFEGKWATIHEDQIHMIRKVTSVGMPFALQPDSYAKEGDSVAITAGTLKGQYGRVRQVKEAKDKCQVVIEVQHTGYALAIEVDRRCITILP